MFSGIVISSQALHLDLYIASASSSLMVYATGNVSSLYHGFKFSINMFKIKVIISSRQLVMFCKVKIQM